MVEYFSRFILIISFITCFNNSSYGWSAHQILASKALGGMDLWDTVPRVEAKSLQGFLMEVEEELAVFLDKHEEWSRANLQYYPPLPAGLSFRATGNKTDVRDRFLRAIRVNPDIPLHLYLCLLPGQSAGGREVAGPAMISIFEDSQYIESFTYVLINEGEFVKADQVLYTANDEPDYGMDIGLFEDNNTPYGMEYGFGNQPFGNPGLEYGSQAPFHMGFFNESAILYPFGPFLRRTLIDYRINLFRALSEFAFDHNQEYWGWRFLGWGMHYAGDLSMPYHSRALPGVSTLRALWLNFKAVIGFPSARDRAIQLVSNRHAVLERFQLHLIVKASIENDREHPFFVALTGPKEDHERFCLLEVAGRAEGMADHLDAAIAELMPPALVSDPGIEATESPLMNDLAGLMEQEKGKEAVMQMTAVTAGLLEQYSAAIRSYMLSVIGKGV